MYLLPFFQWMDGLPVSTILQESAYLSAVNNLVHLLSLVMFFGAMVVVDLRLLGTGLKDLPRARVALDAQPWLIGGFLGLLVTGFFALVPTAMQQYYNSTFWFKMDLLAFGLIFTFTIRRYVALADEARVGRVLPKIVGLVSIVVWAGVAVSARLIMLL
jgi:hypothetical protein